MANFYKKPQISRGRAQQEKAQSGCRGAQQKKAQSGRSMVEMFGVLAIIGMLSIGGIAAYTKAMRRHNVNATAEIFNDIIRSYATFRETVNMGMDHDYYTKDLINLGMYPECKLVPSIYWGGDDKACRTPIGQVDISALSWGKGYPNNLNFYVYVTKDTCADFLSYNWHNVIPKEWGNNHIDGMIVSIIVNPYSTRYTLFQIYENAVVDNYNMAGIAEACNTCKEGEPCLIFFAYGGEI